jgi:hypothetical protein
MQLVEGDHSIVRTADLANVAPEVLAAARRAGILRPEGRDDGGRGRLEPSDFLAREIGGSDLGSGGNAGDLGGSAGDFDGSAGDFDGRSSRFQGTASHRKSR